MTKAEPPWEYGFYDSADQKQTPTIWWYVFGFLNHKTAESARHIGVKSVTERAVIVRRREGSTDWEMADD